MAVQAMGPCLRRGDEMVDIVLKLGALSRTPVKFLQQAKGVAGDIPEIRHFLNLARPLQSTGHPADHRRIWKNRRLSMFAFNLSSVREALVSAAGAMLCSTVLVAAAVLPAQGASAALFHL
jgi:hypothetical protein